MAMLINADNVMSIIVPKDPHFSLQELYELLNCSCVEMLPLYRGQTMWIDEYGKLEARPKNAAATLLLHDAGGAKDDYIAGPALICGLHEID